MADITPPVGLAAFAAAAISREDPIATGFQGALYSLRTAILPFVFIFNPALLLIGIDSVPHLIGVVAISLIAILLFAAATMNWFITKSRLWESAILLLACFTLFRPDWWLDQFYPKYRELPARELLAQVERAPSDTRITLVVEGLNIEGETVRKTVSVPLGDPKEPRLRLRAAGLGVAGAGNKVTITNVAFGSYAKRLGLEAGYEVVSDRAAAMAPEARARLAAFSWAGCRIWATSNVLGADPLIVILPAGARSHVSDTLRASTLVVLPKGADRALRARRAIRAQAALAGKAGE